MDAKQLAEQAVSEYSKVLRSFPKLENGMTPDDVKATPEFKEAKANYQRAFAQLRAINSTKRK